MVRFENGGRHLSVLARLITLVAVISGCDPAASNRLVIATSWPVADCRHLESEFQNWLKSTTAVTRPTAIAINWLILRPGDDLLRVAGRRQQPDVLLGGRASTLGRLAQSDRFTPIQSADAALWSVVSRVASHIANEPSRGPADRVPVLPAAPNVTIADPRSDPISLAWALGQLEHGRFREGYSVLVRVAGNPRRIGGDAKLLVPGSARGLTAQPIETDLSPDWIEGVAILRAAEHQDLAQVFLRFLAETRMLTASVGQPTNETDPAVANLVADLLGATLVDAQDELWAAWAALERAGYPPKALEWMSEPPPWPPASVATILDRPGENAMTLMETLAREIAPEPSIRAWLVRSWLSPPRLVDDTLLTELARAVDGRLCREPRFRDWLRAEWTAWARQRYRRVVRLASF